ncbi:MAG TPA: DUF2249 domain-containing protein [Ktedonobacterales bacterium]|jgi:uncharacterized protein (DUF2249 family)|nr:DUF2249 domain-containing protein [Ktedonobacterales bacterium]
MQVSNEASVWKQSATTVLDVRPTLAAGDEPFEQIMLAAAATPAGEALVIIAPFEPAPLYGALGAQGFAHETRQMAADEWIVRFTRAR